MTYPIRNRIMFLQTSMPLMQCLLVWGHFLFVGSFLPDFVISKVTVVRLFALRCPIIGMSCHSLSEARESNRMLDRLSVESLRLHKFVPRREFSFLLPASILFPAHRRSTSIYLHCCTKTNKQTNNIQPSLSVATRLLQTYSPHRTKDH